LDRLQFGQKNPNREYRDRPTAFGVLERSGKIAVVAIDEPGGPYFDLPGGAVDPGESEAEAMVREFGEEAGLEVSAGELIIRASQWFINKEDRAVNNHGAFLEARLVRENASLKVEEDHELVWMGPQDFVQKARHEAQAWAVCVWLRRQN
jgi:8-oxo-dGTP diphosphatase